MMVGGRKREKENKLDCAEKARRTALAAGSALCELRSRSVYQICSAADLSITANVTRGLFADGLGVDNVPDRFVVVVVAVVELDSVVTTVDHTIYV
jgi:hypothetical protein